MNPDLNPSPMTSAQSWIVENISSLISSNHDDENDCTLTMPNETTTAQKSKSMASEVPGSLEVERSRTAVDDFLQAERIPKRPFSPEVVLENNRQNEQMNIFYNNQHLVSFSSPEIKAFYNFSKLFNVNFE